MIFAIFSFIYKIIVLNKLINLQYYNKNLNLYIFNKIIIFFF